MNSKNINRAIKLQTTINNQIESKGIADIELVDDLNNLLESLNSHECELLCEWNTLLCNTVCPANLY
jgi:hypothetical protein